MSGPDNTSGRYSWTDHTNLSKGKWPREIPMGLLVVYLIKSDVTISYQCGIRPSSFDKTSLIAGI